jgi:signal transduction histidine kinase
MFLHFDFLHLLFNVLYLYWFGRLFMHIIGESYLLRTYLIGGLAGALAFFLAYNFLPVFYGNDNAILMGASASVMAVLFTVARYEPNHKVYLLFFGEVRLKYIALAALIIDLISISNLNNTGGHLAHIGGSLVGLLLGWRWSVKGLPDSRTFMSSPLQDVKNKLSRKPKLSVAHKRPLTDYEYNALKVRRQKELDRILEKIKSNGYESLTAEEKRTLFDASKEGDI